MEENFQELMTREFRRLLDPVIYAAQDSSVRQKLFQEVGWDLENSAAFPAAQFSEKLTQIASSARLMERYIESPPQTLSELLTALDSCADIFFAIREIPTLLDSLEPQGGKQLKQLSEDLINFLVVRYWARFHPTSFRLAQLLTIVRASNEEFAEQIILDKSGYPIRIIQPRATVELKRISALLKDPIALLKEEYIGQNGLITAEDAQNTADKLFPRLANLLHTLGVWAMYGLDERLTSDFGEAGNMLGAGMLTTWFESNTSVNQDVSVDTSFGATLAISPKELGDLGLVVHPFGVLSLTQEFRHWALTYQLSGETGGFAVGPQGLTSLTDLSTSSLGLTLILEKLFEQTESEPADVNVNGNDSGNGNAILLGSTKGTRVEIKGLKLSSGFSYDKGELYFGGMLAVEKAALVISGGDGDGFVNELLPPNEVRAEFDLSIGWTNDRGFYINGSAGLEGTLPICVEIAGILAIDSIYLSIAPGSDGSIEGVTAATVSAELGPFLLVADKMGLSAKMTFPEQGGNLGVANLEIGFHPPKGVGFSIASKFVFGGGYLFHDSETDQYAGVMQIAVADKVLLSGVGLLTTPLPGETKGYSLVVILAAEGFTPIPLGFGFTLTGVGGLLALNRNASIEALQSGLRDGVLDSILFPSDPIAQAPQIVQDLSAVFPVSRGKHLIGPMFQIGWGKPVILTIEIAVLFQLPAPLQVIILGQLASVLPSSQKPVIKVQIEVFGMIDFEKKTFSVDGLLRDSFLGLYNLHGSMAVRGSWGSDRAGFLISAGGFHPAFQPPAIFPKLERLAVHLGSSQNFRLKFEAYFALTSNTVQFGALVDIYAEVSDFSVQGNLSFDALFHFNPFAFETGIHGAVTLSHAGKILMAISLNLTLSGPSPWHVCGQASIEILFVKATVRFDRTFGTQEPPALTESVLITPLIIEALSTPGNWISKLPGSGESLVSFRSLKEQDVIYIHPIADLAVRQSIVPLDTELQKFGNNALSDERCFSINAIKVNGKAVSSKLEPESELFAAAQFFNLSDNEKLSRPSFEQMPAGVKLGMNDIIFGTIQNLEIHLETLIFDPAFGDDSTASPAIKVSADSITRNSDKSSASLSAMHRTSTRRFRSRGSKIKVSAPKYMVVSKMDFSVVGSGEFKKTMGRVEAVEALRKLVARNSLNGKRVQIVRAHEVSVV